MIHRKRNKILYILILILLTSCLEEIDDIEFKHHEPRIIIEGIISTDPSPHQIILSQSTTVENDALSIPIEDAEVRIIESDTSGEILQHIGEGRYITSELKGKSGQVYKLEIIYDNKRYTAENKILPVTKIDSLVYFKEDSTDSSNTNYLVNLYAGRSSDHHINYYRMIVQINDSVYSSIKDLIVINDENVISFNGLELSTTFKLYDTLIVEVQSLNRDVYHYYEDLFALTYQFFNSIYYFPKNPTGNISGDALGIFQASAISRDTLIVK